MLQMRGGSMDVRHGPNRLRYSPAMGPRIRTLLIWLLALALPAQGVAAATMVFCGPNHHGAGPVAHAQHADAEHAHHGSAAQQYPPRLGASHDEHHGAPNGVYHGAHHAGAAQADGASSPVEVADAPAKFHQADSPKCSACASCCSAAAILSSAPAVAAPEFSATVFATVEPSVDPFAADGPDRPPRVVLA